MAQLGDFAEVTVKLLGALLSSQGSTGGLGKCLFPSSLYWLLAGLSMLPQQLLSQLPGMAAGFSFSKTASWHGSWLLPQQMFQETPRESAPDGSGNLCITQPPSPLYSTQK